MEAPQPAKRVNVGLAAYQLFAEEVRKTQPAGLSVAALHKICGPLWKELPDEQRQEYRDRASTAAGQPREEVARKAPKLSGGFKGFRTHVMKELSSANGASKKKLGVCDLMKVVGERWSALPEDQKDEWHQRAQAEKADLPKADTPKESSGVPRPFLRHYTAAILQLDENCMPVSKSGMDLLGRATGALLKDLVNTVARKQEGKATVDLESVLKECRRNEKYAFLGDALRGFSATYVPEENETPAKVEAPKRPAAPAPTAAKVARKVSLPGAQQGVKMKPMTSFFAPKASQ